MSKRIKYVFTDNEAIAHLWIGHNLSGEGQAHARNPRHNFYFQDTTIYSYGSHFPIAVFVTNGKKKAIQITTRGYSPTTSGHIQEVKSAIRGNKLPVFRLQNPNAYDARETPRGIEDYLSRINIAIADQAKSRSTHNIESFQGSALALKAECQSYCKFWKVKAPKFPKIQKLPADFKARQAREIELQTARDARKRVQREAERARWAKDNAERLTKETAEINEWNQNIETHIAEWLAGGSLNQPHVSYYGGDSLIPRLVEIPTLLRIKGNEVETSRYATFPIDHAKRGLALVRSVMTRGEDWKANGHTCKLGLYAIDRITADGTVYAGCHVVPYSSIDRIAAQIEAL